MDGTADKTADKTADELAANATRIKYSMTAKDDWTKIVAGQPGRQIDPIPYTGGNEFLMCGICCLAAA